MQHNILYICRILLQCTGDINKQDVDGWTPLHAAAHWSQREAAELLVNNGADMDAQNYAVSFHFVITLNFIHNSPFLS